MQRSFTGPCFGRSATPARELQHTWNAHVTRTEFRFETLGRAPCVSVDVPTANWSTSSSSIVVVREGPDLGLSLGIDIIRSIIEFMGYDLDRTGEPSRQKWGLRSPISHGENDPPFAPGRKAGVERKVVRVQLGVSPPFKSGRSGFESGSRGLVSTGRGCCSSPTRVRLLGRSSHGPCRFLSLPQLQLRFKIVPLAAMGGCCFV